MQFCLPLGTKSSWKMKADWCSSQTASPAFYLLFTSPNRLNRWFNSWLVLWKKHKRSASAAPVSGGGGALIGAIFTKTTGLFESDSILTGSHLRLKEKLGNRKAVNPYLSCDGWPDFQRVVVRAADDAVATELEAGDHVVVMTFQHLLR